MSHLHTAWELKNIWKQHIFIPDEKYVLAVVTKRLLTRLILLTALILALGCDGAGAFNSACCRQTCKIHAKLIFKLRLYEAEKHHFNW